MTARQKIIKTFYPLLMWANKITGKNTAILSHPVMLPPVDIYSLTVMLNDGTPLSLSRFRGKKILLVNTASDCGYTSQYNGLQKLYSRYQGNLVVIGFPANDFKEQEKGSDEEIASFCKKNFGVAFPLAKKTVVIKSPEQNKIFQWLTDPAKNGWNSQAPSWNFCKYLLDEEGRLINYFGPGIEPMGEELTRLLK